MHPTFVSLIFFFDPDCSSLGIWLPHNSRSMVALSNSSMDQDARRRPYGAPSKALHGSGSVSAASTRRMQSTAKTLESESGHLLGAGFALLRTGQLSRSREVSPR